MRTKGQNIILYVGEQNFEGITDHLFPNFDVSEIQICIIYFRARFLPFYPLKICWV